jgi:hypothetical protein
MRRRSSTALFYKSTRERPACAALHPRCRAMHAMLKMKKLDIAELERAAAG